MKQLWNLSPDLLFLNHGSFGAPPLHILDLQQKIRSEVENAPDHFYVFGALDRMYAAKAELARFVGAAADDIAWVKNATSGVNAVVRSLRFNGGDEILTTDHVYNACGNVLDYQASVWGARVVRVEIPFPIDKPSDVTERVVAAVSERTRLALIDHITSPSALIFPVSDIVRELAKRGIDVLIDGAHAPGQVELDLPAIGAAYYTGNCHKWLCAPRGSAFLYVRKDRQELIHPAIISHGSNARDPERSLFQRRFQSVGTDDLSSLLCVPETIAYIGRQLRGGWPAIMRRNHALALNARRLLCERLGIASPAPEEMIGSMFAIPLLDGQAQRMERALEQVPISEARAFMERDGVMVRNPVPARFCYLMHKRFGIDGVGFRFDARNRFIVRVCAHLYNEHADYERLLSALEELIA